MKEKKWINCPVCGAKKSMQSHTGISEKLKPKGYPAITIDGLSAQLCDVCDEGFWSLASERKLQSALAEHRARHDAKRVFAADLASIHEAAAQLSLTPQGVHKMMDEGRLRYVYAAERRYPIRNEIAKLAAAARKSQ